MATRAVRQSSEPFFLFTNFLDAHHHYQHHRGLDRNIHGAPNSFVTSIPEDLKINLGRSHDGYETYLKHRRGLYAAAVDYLDRVVSSFVDTLQAVTDHPTTIVLTADHGDNLGFDADDGLVHHKGSMNEALLHVPCEVVNPPSGYDATESAYFSQLELGTLLAGVARGETPTVTTDRIAAERIGTYSWPQFQSYVTDLGYDWDDARISEEYAFWDRAIRCVYEGTDKYAWDSQGHEWRYHLDSARPCWQERAADVPPPEWAESFFGEPLRDYKERVTVEYVKSVPVDDRTAARLKSLGYL
jgi:hypothetical protein